MTLSSEIRTRAKELLDGTLYDGTPDSALDNSNRPLRPGDLRWLGMPPASPGVDASLADRGFFVEVASLAVEQQPGGPNAYDAQWVYRVRITVSVGYRYAADAVADDVEPLLNLYDTEDSEWAAAAPRERAIGDAYRIDRALTYPPCWGVYTSPVARDAVVPTVAGCKRVDGDAVTYEDAGGLLVASTVYEATVTVDTSTSYR